MSEAILLVSLSIRCFLRQLMLPPHLPFARGPPWLSAAKIIARFFSPSGFLSLPPEEGEVFCFLLDRSYEFERFRPFLNPLFFFLEIFFVSFSRFRLAFCFFYSTRQSSSPGGNSLAQS